MRHSLAFTLIEILLVVAIVTILATLGKATYHALIVYAHRAEAKNNLAHIRTLQAAYHEELSAYLPLAAVGYVGSGASICSGAAYNNALGFHPDNCNELRYEYSANVNGQELEVFAYGRSDIVQKRIYPKCSGRGAWQYGKNQGDLLSIKHDRWTEVCRDIVEYCPASGSTGSSASKCGTPLAAGTSTPINPNLAAGVTPVPFTPLGISGTFVPIERRTAECEGFFAGESSCEF